ncbi:hypothetical protein [Streptomyces sp. NPDC093591]|uniref:hypothetical protein n=1 Tax=Streptomyces sp. NPDC093591 TaxID=3366044 RepID=UPI0038296050
MGPDTTIAIEHEGEPELRILPEHYQDVIAGDLPTETTDVLAVTQRSVRVQALTAELSGAPAWRSLPSWAVVGTADNATPAQVQEFMAERAGSTVVQGCHGQVDGAPNSLVEGSGPPRRPHPGHPG